MVNTPAGLALEVHSLCKYICCIYDIQALDHPVPDCLISLNVRLCGTYCGLSDSYDGSNHQAITDVAAMRVHT